MNNNSSHSGGGATVALPAMPSIPRSGFDTNNESDTPLQPVRRCPSNDVLDLVPQPPIRQESCSLHSQSLYDLDPHDSVPRPPRRRSSSRLHTSSYKRIQTRVRDELSSCDSSLRSPPSTVLVPQDSSLWSAGISTLMSHEEDDRPGYVPPHPPLQDDEAFIAREKLPWDKIAIGVVCGAGDVMASSKPPPAPLVEFRRSPSDEGRSQDTSSCPSFHQGETAHCALNAPPECWRDSRAPRDESFPSNMSSIRRQSPPPPNLAGGDRFASASLTSPLANAALHKPCRSPSQEQMITNINSARQHLSLESGSNNWNYSFPTEALISPPPFEQNTSSGLLAPMQAHSRSINYRSRNATALNHVSSSRALPQTWSQKPLPTGVTSTFCTLGGITIEVAPGIRLPLRGSDETWKAIEEGQVTVTSCISCQQDLNCVLDAQLVVCPDCSMLSPVDQTTQDADSSADRYGVGLGVKPADIIRWVERHMN